MFEVGEKVRWMSPLDADYSYGTITEIEGKKVLILASGYYTGRITEVHISDIEKIKKQRGGKKRGRGKKHRKLSTT